VKKLKPGKKCTDTENEAKKIRSEAFLQSQAAAILIPSKIKKQLNMPELNPLKVPELNPLKVPELNPLPDEPEKKKQQHQEKGKRVKFYQFAFFSSDSALVTLNIFICYDSNRTCY
jgi:hypothetical protein